MNNINFLEEKFEFKYLKEDTKCINIGYGVDDNFMRGMMTSIVSFCMNNNRNFKFYIVTSNLSEDNKIKLKTIAEQYNINIYIYKIDTKTLKKLPVFIHLPISMYFRFVLPVLLKDISKLFYIDADIICLKNAENLFDVNLNENIIAAVPDQDDKRSNTLKLENHIYFNSGMLVIDIKKWNELDFLKKAIDLLIENPKIFKFPDQDVLNIIFTNKVKYLDVIFNCFVDYRNCRRKINNKDIVLLHFSALPKPWNIAWPISKIVNAFNEKIYFYYEEKTPWKGVPLYKPKSYKEIGTYVKALHHNHEYIRAFIWLIRYILIRLKYNIGKNNNYE